MADPYADFSTPAGGDPYAEFSTPVPAPRAATTVAPATVSGGIPRVPGRFGGLNPGSAYFSTRLGNVLAGVAGTPRMLSDLLETGERAIGLPTGHADPITMAGQFMPSAEDIRGFIHKTLGVPEVNTPGEAGKILDTGVEAGMAGVTGGPRALVPAFLGGATSQASGDIPGIKGTKAEPFVRGGTGLLIGGLTGLAQNSTGSLVQAIKNALATGKPEDTASRIVGRSLARDNLPGLTPGGPEQPLFTGGGENVRGALRGSIANPGEARTTFNDRAQAYLSGSDRRADTAVSQNVSSKPPMATRINTLEEERAAASTPAYEAAGIPRNIEATETTVPTTRPSLILDAEGNPLSITEQTTVKTFNTPTVTSDKIDALLRDSKDVQAAISAARRLPQYKDLPATSMAMLDKAYKHLEGLEQTAVRAGNGARAFDLGNLRRNLRSALAEANPAYAKALDVFSSPSRLVDASQSGFDFFAKNVPADEVARTFKMMPQDQRDEFLGGVAQWLRQQAGRTQGETNTGVNMPPTAAEKMFNTQAVADKLKAILPPDKYKALAGTLTADKRGAQLMRQVGQGSRTTPMAAEAADNAKEAASIIGNLMSGRFLGAAGKFLGSVGSRIGEGRNEAVNNVIADWLTTTDPQKIGLVRSLAEQARRDALARSQGRLNALTYGSTVPGVLGASQGVGP